MSPGGSFMAGSETIETSPVTLTMNVRNGSGTASETIMVPVRVLERVMNKRLTGFTYVRNFSGSTGAFSASVNFTIATEAGADFDIKSIGLYFENRRPEATVEQNIPNLRAYADIRSVGSGLLEGYWEVDGRILSKVSMHLTFAGTVTLETPETPPLPTFDPGSHVVSFVVTNPHVGIQMPSMLYFVVPGSISCSIVQMRLLAPADGAEVAFEQIKFEWEQVKDTSLYLIAFYESRDAKPIFSAFAKRTSYRLPGAVLKSVFRPGKKYFWKVTGFDSKRNVICQNKAQSFVFRE